MLVKLCQMFCRLSPCAALADYAVPARRLLRFCTAARKDSESGERWKGSSEGDHSVPVAFSPLGCFNRVLLKKLLLIYPRQG